jgi:hypothetical protein
MVINELTIEDYSNLEFRDVYKSNLFISVFVNGVKIADLKVYKDYSNNKITKYVIVNGKKTEIT